MAAYMSANKSWTRAARQPESPSPSAHGFHHPTSCSRSRLLNLQGSSNGTRCMALLTRLPSSGRPTAAGYTPGERGHPFGTGRTGSGCSPLLRTPMPLGGVRDPLSQTAGLLCPRPSSTLLPSQGRESGSRRGGGGRKPASWVVQAGQGQPGRLSPLSAAAAPTQAPAETPTEVSEELRQRPEVGSLPSPPPTPLTGVNTSTWPTMAARRALLSASPEQVEPIEAEVRGRIPAWLAGSLFSNGGGDYSAMQHVFDGLSMISKMEVREGRVFGSQRYLQSQSYTSFKATGQLAKVEFVSTPPWQNAWEQFVYRVDASLALAMNRPKMTDNASITLTQLPDGNLLALSEVKNAAYLVDPHTLETLQNRMLFKEDNYTLQTSHTKQLPDGRLVGFTTTSVIRGETEVYVMDPVTWQRTVLARIPHRESTGAMIHDFAMTDKYIILMEPPVFYYAPAMIAGVMTAELAGVLEWKPELGTAVYVIPLDGSGQVLTYTAPAFFMTHTANTYEREDGACLYVDFSCAADAAMLNDYFVELLLRYPGRDASKSWLRRLTIPLKPANRHGTVNNSLLISPQPVVRDEAAYGELSDLPAINPAWQGKRNRYVYSVCVTRPSNLYNSLVKLDLYSRKTEAVWHLPGCVTGEPHFVAAPGATSEDEGALLAQITLPNGHAALLVLDARTFQQLAIAEMPYGTGYRFHGTWVPAAAS